MSSILRFFFDSADQGRMVAGPVVTDEQVFSPPIVSSLYSSMAVSFKLQQPGTGPKIRILAPGYVTFHAVPGSAPPPVADAEGTLDPAPYAAWPTRGMLCLRMTDEKVLNEIRRISGLEVTPTRIWYGPVVVPEAFLRVALPALSPVQCGRPPLAIAPGTEEWVGNAIAGFLAGMYVVRFLSDRNGQDDLARDDLPYVPVDADLRGKVYVVAASAPTPRDGPDTALDALSSTADQLDPAHPRNGSIPARHVYRRCRGANDDAMQHANPADKVAAAVMIEAPADPEAPIYVPIRFTRIFAVVEGKPDQEASVYFPRRTIQIERADFAQPFATTLPVHGMVYLPMRAAQLAASRDVTIQVLNPPEDPEGELRVLPWSADAWKTSATSDRMIGFLPQDQPLHVLLRRPLRFEILREAIHRPGGGACTYMSLRRFVRALVDQRITGGRLNLRCKQTDAAMKSLLERTLGEELAGDIADDQPKWWGLANDDDEVEAENIAAQAVRLEPVLGAFFGPKGPVHYFLWQSATLRFAGEPASYPANLLGGGGAAAAISMGLAQAFAFDPPPPNTVANQYEAQITANVDRVMSGVLLPGATLQMWSTIGGYLEVRARQPVSPRGHSPIFSRYNRAGEAPGIFIIDQLGEFHCKRVGDRLLWRHDEIMEIWLAANWTEP